MAVLVAGTALFMAIGRSEGPKRLAGRALPGAEPFPAELDARLAQALAARGPGYRPRTHHLEADGSPTYTNRLILESSPYLVQHAHNPVNWFSWAEEAFALAMAEGKPVLLSVGYSTCHWCHVMEAESFEDEEIAEFINRYYVAIKVDREERPDIDAVYMAAVQALSGNGGWPMTVWLTPDRQPFYGGTYFPPRDGDRGARVGFLTLLRRLREIYDQQPDKVAAAARDITEHVARTATPPPGSGLPGTEVLDRAAASFLGSFDARHGGFGGAPKFPRSVTLEFLLRYHRRTGDSAALAAVVKTLEAMSAGGIHDHIGGGFHRYSTDRRWLVPHFEKMLYDNALLVVAYLEAFQVTGREEFAEIARETLRYVEREMTSPEGAFYSASDADSEGEEGRFFVWTPAELEAVIGPEPARLVAAFYGVTARGNFAGRNILHTPRPLAEVAVDLGVSADELRAAVEDARPRLYAARAKRVPPHTDRKIITAWNGLMISGFARAAQVLGEERYATRAARAAEFILAHARRGERLARTVKDGRVGPPGYLDDYAFLAAALLDLYEVTFEPRWLRVATSLQDVLGADFWDRDDGGFFLTAADADGLLAREKPVYDGAEPSGNSVALLNLLRLHEFTTNDRYRAMVDQALGHAFAQVVRRGPTAVPRMLCALDFRLDRPKEVIIVTAGGREAAEPFLAVLRRTFLPNRVVAVAAAGRDIRRQQELIPLFREKTARGGAPTAYVCERGVCKLPTADPSVFARQVRAR